MVDIQRIETGQLRTNCYVVSAANRDTIVIDPGDHFETIAAAIVSKPGHKVHGVLCTHGHFDHVMAAAALNEVYGAPVHLHPADMSILRRSKFFHRLLQDGEPFEIPPIDTPLADGMTLSFGQLEAKVVHTPGHSPGSVCLEIDDVLFTGDTIGPGGLGRTDIPGGNAEAMGASFLRLTRDYGPSMLLYPGHGPRVRLGDVSIGIEAERSPARSKPRDS